jgi:hypothetical protein
MSTFYYDGNIYTSVNSTHLPPIPPREEQPISFAQVRRPRWLSDIYPYLALIPVTVRLSGRILGRLSIPGPSVAIENGSYWVLQADRARAWQRLEDALVWMYDTLEPLSRFGVQPDLNPITYPNRCGYLRYHASPEDAKRSAVTSRDAFIIVLAHVAWVILMFDKEPTAANPKWMQHLVPRQPQSIGWFQEFSRTEFFDFTRETLRVGAFVDVSTTIWTQELHAMADAGVPLWFYWGPEPSLRRRRGFERFFPTREAIQLAVETWSSHQLRTRQQLHEPPRMDPGYYDAAARVEVIAVPLSQEITPEDPQPIVTSPPPKPPKPFVNSGQREGETIKEFFARRERAHAKIRFKASSQEVCHSFRHC